MLLLKYIGKKFYTRIQGILRNTLNTIAPFGSVVVKLFIFV